MKALSQKEKEALSRLIRVAKRDTGQSRRVADFLLAWWNAGQCGGFDFTTMWGCDQEIVDDMVTVFAFVGNNSSYPDSFGLNEDFSEIVRLWRPNLKD